MLEPKSGRTHLAYPSPSKLLSKKKLKQAWLRSRDRTSKPGRSGIDQISAQAFAANLDENLTRLARDIKLKNYGPTKLKAVFIPKPNSTKERLICIPTVTDRLVQRTIVEYLVLAKKLPIYNSSSFGFIKGRGASAAIKTAEDLRSQYDWCLKTDIEKFFDSIPRSYLKSQVAKALPRSSLVPLISRFIDCNLKLDGRVRTKLRKQNLDQGAGLRQGMPLSPILANLVLSNFDREIENANIPMVRYADDLLLFFKTREAAQSGHAYVRKVLEKIELKIPEIADDSKTQIFGPRETVSFLGREIVYLASQNRYVSCVGKKQIDKIRKKIRAEYSYAELSKQGDTLQTCTIDLWRSVSAYLAVYRNAHDFKTLEQNLRETARSTMVCLLGDIFGHSALTGLDNYKRNFLGIGVLNIADGANEIDPS